MRFVQAKKKQTSGLYLKPLKTNQVSFYELMIRLPTGGKKTNDMYVGHTTTPLYCDSLGVGGHTILLFFPIAFRPSLLARPGVSAGSEVTARGTQRRARAAIGHGMRKPRARPWSAHGPAGGRRKEAEAPPPAGQTRG